MSAQIQDTVEFEGTDYLLVNYRGEVPFAPDSLGLEVTGTSSICWRGFACSYRIEDNTLKLVTLEASVGRYEGPKFVKLDLPVINGAQGQRPQGKDQVFNAKYEQLNLLLPYTGTLVLADKFDDSLGEHTGLEPAWMYRDVLELTFKEGTLVELNNLSDEMNLIRSQKIGSIR